MKPVLHAGEVSLTSTSINGKVLDSVTGNPVNGTVLVALEQKDSTGVDRVSMSMLAGADGSFVFCPLPTALYDVVIVGTRSDGTLYQPTIVTAVATGATTGTVKLVPPTVALTSSVTFTGSVTSQNTAMAGTLADVQVSALETGGTVVYTIPLPPTSAQNAATLAVETAQSATCPAGTDCAAYTLTLPSGGPYIGAWSATTISPSQNSVWASYVIDGLAFVPSSGGTADCSPSEQKTQTYTLTAAGPFTINPAATLPFTMCQ